MHIGLHMTFWQSTFTARVATGTLPRAGRPGVPGRAPLLPRPPAPGRSPASTHPTIRHLGICLVRHHGRPARTATQVKDLLGEPCWQILISLLAAVRSEVWVVCKIINSSAQPVLYNLMVSMTKD